MSRMVLQILGAGVVRNPWGGVLQRICKRKAVADAGER